MLPRSIAPHRWDQRPHKETKDTYKRNLSEPCTPHKGAGEPYNVMKPRIP